MPGFLKDAKTKVEVHFGIEGLSKARVIDLLPSRDLVGLLVVDREILIPQNAYLLSKVVEYAKNGGTLVFGWQFCKLVTLTQFRPLFRDNFGLDWDMVGVHLATFDVKANKDNSLVKGKSKKLPKSTSIYGVQIKGIDKTMAVYHTRNRTDLWNPDRNVFKASILFTPVENGFLGYIGAATVDDDIRSILYAMFGLL